MLKNENRVFTLNRVAGHTAEEVRANWLKLRQSGIGGSDVAAIMGLSPWKGAYTLWAEKTGRVEPRDISGEERVAMGNELEDDVRDMYKRRNPGSAVCVVNAVARSIERPWAQASVDGLTRDPKLGVGILEIKTGGSEDRWKDGVPVYYLTQVTHYMSVTGYPFADVAVLVGDHGLHYHQFRVMRDEDDVRAVDEAVDSFWNDFVLADVPPFAKGIDSDALMDANQQESDEIRAADGDSRDEVDRLAKAILESTSAKKVADQAIKDAQARLKQLIGNDKGICTDKHSAVWSRYERTKVDSKKLKELHPEAYQDCTSTYSSSRLIVKKG